MNSRLGKDAESDYPPTVSRGRGGFTVSIGGLTTSQRAGRSYNVQWEMPESGPVPVSVSLDSGRAWVDLVRGYTGKDRLPIYPWTPAKELGTSNRCLLRVRSEADSTLQADMTGAFQLMQ